MSWCPAPGGAGPRGSIPSRGSASKVAGTVAWACRPSSLQAANPLYHPSTACVACPPHASSLTRREAVAGAIRSLARRKRSCATSATACSREAPPSATMVSRFAPMARVSTKPGPGDCGAIPVGRNTPDSGHRRGIPDLSGHPLPGSRERLLAHCRDMGSEAGHPVLVNILEAVTVLVERAANGVRAFHKVASSIDVLRLERPLIALEQFAHLGDDVGDIRGEVLHAVSSTALSTATSIASCPCAPTMEKPTGRPLTVVPGILTCGTPVGPPCAARH